MTIASLRAVSPGAILPADVPVDPEAPEARDWLIDELSKAPYQAAKPTWFDLMIQAIWDWLNSLTFAGVEGPPAFGLLALVVIVVAALVVIFLVFGMPRLNRSSRVAGALFGDEDDRGSDSMRKAAHDAAAAGDFALATAEMFRSIARGLAERTIVSTTPGTTARGFSLRAASAFPGFAARLGDAANAFDEVRYLGGSGSREQFDSVAALECDLRSTRPNLEPAQAGTQAQAQA